MWQDSRKNKAFLRFYTGILSGQHAAEEMAARLCLQQEGGRDEKWCDQKGQHVGQTHLQKSTGTCDIYLIIKSLLFALKRIRFGSVSRYINIINTCFYAFDIF